MVNEPCSIIFFVNTKKKTIVCLRIDFLQQYSTSDYIKINLYKIHDVYNQNNKMK